MMAGEKKYLCNCVLLWVLALPAPFTLLGLYV